MYLDEPGLQKGYVATKNNKTISKKMQLNLLE